ncbi:F-box DNA helicase 1 isoform X3 [Penaeus vannamei]|uniref:F-box DNA helicase 1 isoform X3 n=1 Tax=Penaeus vannamei TaxID=6689 RepID=UPI00387F6F9E
MLLALGTRTERVAENVIRDGVAGLPTSTQWVTGGLALDNCIFAAWHWKRHGWRCARTWTERFTASVRQRGKMAEVCDGSSLPDLPEEIWEKVLVWLPFPTILRECSTVNRSWSNIIKNPKFIPWKKMYYQMKIAPKRSMSASLLSEPDKKIPAKAIFKKLCVKHKITSSGTFPAIISMIGKVHMASDVSIDNFKRLPLYNEAVEKLQHLGFTSPNVWHIVTMIVMLSDNVWQIDKLLRHLLARDSIFSPIIIIEVFYCLATFFLHCMRKYSISQRYHYIVIYALHLYENWKPQSQQGIQHTEEQLRIINHILKPKDVVRVIGFSGTGIKTTLHQICRQHPEKEFLLVVYNKEMQIDIRKKMELDNVTVKTIHALAYQEFSDEKIDSQLSSSKIARFLEGYQKYTYAYGVKNTLQNFWNSDDDHLMGKHIPMKDRSTAFKENQILTNAQVVWQEMKKGCREQKIAMCQDGMLKLRQLSKQQIDGYDVIMFYGGQDMNAVMSNIILRQKCAKIIAGDPYQQIYTFKDAVSALQKIRATHTYYLTQSFRFGPEISYMVYCTLKTFKRVERPIIVSGRKRDHVYVKDKEHSEPPIDQNLKSAYLARTNVALYKHAISMCEDERYSGVSMRFAGKLDSYKFEDVLDIYKLHLKESGSGAATSQIFSNKHIAKFKSVDELRWSARTNNDIELSNKIKMFDFSKDKTPQHHELLEHRCRSDVRRAEITFSTIHKSKGLAFDWVMLLDDIGKPEPMQDQNEDEYNLIYVAITRAKKELIIKDAELYQTIIGNGRDGFEVKKQKAGEQPNTPTGKKPRLGNPDYT